MNNRLNKRLGSWNWLRLLRFALGIFMGIQAIHGRDVLAGILSAILLWQVYANVGCSGQACALPPTKTNAPTDRK